MSAGPLLREALFFTPHSFHPIFQNIQSFPPSHNLAHTDQPSTRHTWSSCRRRSSTCCRSRNSCRSRSRRRSSCSWNRRWGGRSRCRDRDLLLRCGRGRRLRHCRCSNGDGRWRERWWHCGSNLCAYRYAGGYKLSMLAVTRHERLQG